MRPPRARPPPRRPPRAEVARRRREVAEQEVVRLLQKPSGMAWPSGSAKRQIMRPSPSSSAEDVVDHWQRARVATLDGAGLPALWALQPLPGPARPQRPARPGQDPSHTTTYSHTCRLWQAIPLLLFLMKLLTA